MASAQYAVGWGTLALINAGLAQGKGHNGLPWFLASFVLGPIATLIIVLLPNQIHVDLTSVEQSLPGHEDRPK